MRVKRVALIDIPLEVIMVDIYTRPIRATSVTTKDVCAEPSNQPPANSQVQLTLYSHEKRWLTDFHMWSCRFVADQ